MNAIKIPSKLQDMPPRDAPPLAPRVDSFGSGQEGSEYHSHQRQGGFGEISVVGAQEHAYGSWGDTRTGGGSSPSAMPPDFLCDDVMVQNVQQQQWQQQRAVVGGAVDGEGDVNSVVRHRADNETFGAKNLSLKNWNIKEVWFKRWSSIMTPH